MNRKMKAAVAARVAAGKDKFAPPLVVGGTYSVRGYHTGEFIGQVESCDRDIAVLMVIDPLRPQRKRGCPFPQCIAEADHDGSHLFPTLAAGHRIEIPWKLARFEAPPVRVLEFPAASPDPLPRGAA